jgi:hypothetical protein
VSSCVPSAAFVHFHFVTIAFKSLHRLCIHFLSRHGRDSPPLRKGDKIRVLRSNHILDSLRPLKQDTIDHPTEISWNILLLNNTLCFRVIRQTFAFFPRLEQLFRRLNPKCAAWSVPVDVSRRARTRLCFSVQKADRQPRLCIYRLGSSLQFIQLIEYLNVKTAFAG